MKYNFLSKAFLQGKFIDFKDANISVATHALHYGTAAFGGLRGYINPDNQNQVFLFRLKDHCKRLANSAKYLNYNLSSQKIEKTILDFVKINSPKNSFYIRPLAYASDLGISPRLHNLEKDLLIYGIELGDYLSADGVTCRFSSWHRQEDRSLPLRGKISGAYITSSLAKTEAQMSGFDEALLLNSKGKIAEATGMNLFIVRDGKLITPGFEEDILEGITRDSVIKIAKDFDIPVQERAVDKSEILIADEAFLCGTAAKISPILKVENYTLPEPKPITTKLKAKLSQITLNKDPNYQDWVNVIEI